MMDSRIWQTVLVLLMTVSSAEALYKPGNFLIIMISVLLPACVLLGFCIFVGFICKNRKRIPLLRSKFGTHEKLPKSAPPAAKQQQPSAPPPMMPPPGQPAASTPLKGGDDDGGDAVKPAVV